MMLNRPHPRLRPSRRTLIAILLAGATTPLLLRDQVNAQGATASAPRPFRVDIPQATIDRIINRVRDAEWPDRLDASDWRYGTNWDYMKTLAEYWAEQYNWREAEANLNRYPQFLASVGDFDIHFYHVKGRGPRPVPLILTHGWPGSVYEFLEAIGPLSDPVSFGGSADDAFDLVVPSLPGYGFSSKPSGKPIGPVTTAALWNRLMTEVLGYTRYGAQGGDLANGIMRHLGLAYRDSLVGLHFNNIRLDNVPAPPESEQSPEERAWRSEVTAYLTTEFAYNFEQRYKPQTVALALSDNPVGAAAWMVEKLKVWSDSPDSFEPIFSKDQVLTNVMIYLVTNTVGTAAWFYRGLNDEPLSGGKVMVPTGFASSPREMPPLNPPENVVARNLNLVHYTKMKHGGHFAFWEQPDAMVADVRQFFRKLRT
jgi:pimeloyl-ACP methyl ester carboxylesterase